LTTIVDASLSIPENPPLFYAIKENGWQPEAILLTHHHNDHTGGVPELRAHFPHLVVYGPAEAQDKGITQVVEEGEKSSYASGSFPYLPHRVTLWDICVSTVSLIFFAATRCSQAAAEGCLKAHQRKCISLYRRLTRLPDDTSFVAHMSIH
jgi:hydroxyacylglutathione hydrolase